MRKFMLATAAVALVTAVSLSAHRAEAIVPAASMAIQAAAQAGNSIIGEFVPSRVPEHVRMNWKWELCGFSNPRDRLEEARGRGGTTTLGNENVS